MTRLSFLFTAAALLLAAVPAARADARTQLIRSAAEHALERFGIRTATREAADVLATQITAAAAKHGDQVIAAVRQVGPKALRLVEEAGTHSPQLGARAARLLADEGEQAAACVLSRPQTLAQFARYGEDAAQALIKHKSIAEPLIEAGGQPAAAALKALAPQSGRRLALMAAEGGDAATLARSPEMLGILARYGDPACDFVWRHKGALAVTAVAAAFVAHPEPYLNGARDLAGVALENAVKPLAEVPAIAAREGAAEVARSTNWTLVFSLAVLALAALLLARFWLKARLRLSPSPGSHRNYPSFQERGVS